MISFLHWNVNFCNAENVTVHAICTNFDSDHKCSNKISTQHDAYITITNSHQTWNAIQNSINIDVRSALWNKLADINLISQRNHERRAIKTLAFVVTLSFDSSISRLRFFFPLYIEIQGFLLHHDIPTNHISELTNYKLYIKNFYNTHTHTVHQFYCWLIIEKFIYVELYHQTFHFTKEWKTW